MWQTTDKELFCGHTGESPFPGAIFGLIELVPCTGLWSKLYLWNKSYYSFVLNCRGVAVARGWIFSRFSLSGGMIIK